MRYPSYERLIASARPTGTLWQLGLGVCVIMLVTFGLHNGVFAIIHVTAGQDAAVTLQTAVETATSPGGMLALLALMGGLGIATLVAAQTLHGRELVDLTGAPGPALRQGLRVLGALALLYLAVLILPPWPKVPDIEAGVPAGLWLMLLPATGLALLVQVGSEELLFRGYLQSQLAARFPQPAVWLIVPSALFALGHHAPALFGENAIWVTAWAFLFGLAAADLTARSGTLGPAIALHLANNVMAIAILALPGEMSGLALYQLPFGTDDTAAIRSLLPLDLMMLALAWLVARIALRV